MVYWQLFLSFFKIGLFTFGGGYAMLPLIRETVIVEHGWATLAEFIDILAVVEMTPGPIAINSATFIGYRAGGIFGSIAATFGVVLPSVVIIICIAKFMSKFSGNRYIRWAFEGIRPVVLGLILSAVLSVGQNTIGDITAFLLAGVFFVLAVFAKLHPIAIILIAGVAGCILY